MIRDILVEDASIICEIYNYYIEYTTVSFEETVVDKNVMAKRILDTIKRYPWIVYEKDGCVVGYAYATEFRERTAFRFSAELSIYVSQKNTNCGVGAKLYTEMFARLKKQGIVNVIALVAVPNDQSASFHKKLGFKPVGHLNNVGYKFGNWVDLEYWEKSLSSS